jgi:hypothetical protein
VNSVGGYSAMSGTEGGPSGENPKKATGSFVAGRRGWLARLQLAAQNVGGPHADILIVDSCGAAEENRPGVWRFARTTTALMHDNSRGQAKQSCCRSCSSRPAAVNFREWKRRFWRMRPYSRTVALLGAQ